jgi:iron(III) transport system permease protein
LGQQQRGEVICDEKGFRFLRSRILPVELFALQNIISWIALFFVLLIVLYPLIVILFASFQEGGPARVTGYSLKAWRVALSEPGMTMAVWNTVTLTVARQAIAFPIAILLAWVLARTDMPGARWLEFLFWIAYFLPTLPVAMGWILLLDPDYGLLNRLVMKLPFVKQGPFNIYSFWGIVWTHLATNTIAIKVMLLTPVFRNMDAALEDASRVSGAGGIKTLCRIVVPVMKPAVLVVLIMSIIQSLQTFELELVLGFPIRFYVFSTRIYSLLHDDPPMFASATALSTIILVLMLPLVLLQRRLTANREYAVVSGRFRAQKAQLHRWKWPVFFVVSCIALTVTVLPFSIVTAGTFMKVFGFFGFDKPWTLAHWKAVIGDSIFFASLKNTLLLAASAAIASVLLFTLLGYIIVRTRFIARNLLDLISWLPSMLPGIILGLGYLSLLLGVGVLQPLYGTMAAMLVAVVINRMTLGVQIIKSNFMQVGNELEEASAVSGASQWNTLRHILLPLAMPTMLLVGAVSFIAAARDVSTVVLLTTTGTRPLSLLQLDLLAQGNHEGAAVVGVIVVLLTTGVALVARLAGLRVGIQG